VPAVAAAAAAATTAGGATVQVCQVVCGCEEEPRPPALFFYPSRLYVAPRPSFGRGGSEERLGTAVLLMLNCARAAGARAHGYELCDYTRRSYGKSVWVVQQKE